MPTYTYEVDHGNDSPEITAGMEINGGKLTAVQFDSALERADKLQLLIQRVTLLGRMHNYVGDNEFENAVVALEQIT